jgi:DNA-binding transcriptional ArsR family regulator
MEKVTKKLFTKPPRTAVVKAVRAIPDLLTSAKLAEFYSAFADPGRIRIISALKAAGELCVKDIARVTAASESAISHQLKTLRLMRLVAARNEGRRTFYRLDDNHIHDILQAGMSHISEAEAR